MIVASARYTRYMTPKINALSKTMPRFLADGEGVTSCADNLVVKHFKIFLRCTSDPINTNLVLSGLSFNFLEDNLSEFIKKYRDFLAKEINTSGYRRRKDDVWHCVFELHC